MGFEEGFKEFRHAKCWESGREENSQKQIGSEMEKVSDRDRVRNHADLIFFFYPTLSEEDGSFH